MFTSTSFNQKLASLRATAGIGLLALSLGWPNQLGAQIIPGLMSQQGPSSGPGPMYNGKLVGTSAYFGQGVALEGDTMVVGAPFVDLVTKSGRTFVYTRSGGVWSLQQELVPTDGDYHQFGYAAAIEGDTMVIGAYGQSDWLGYLYVFERSGGSWVQTARREVATGGGYFAEEVAISGDRIVTSTINDSSFRGAVYVYERDFGGAGNWGQAAKITAPDAAVFDEFGSSVALDGDTLVVGAEYDDDKGLSSGSAYVFTYAAGAWSMQQKLTASNGLTNDRFGTRVAILGDTVAVGSGHGSFARESLYFFTRTAGAWSESQRFLNLGGVSALAFSGETLAVGSHLVYPDGQAYLFSRKGGAWALKRTFAPPNVYRRSYGAGIALDGVTLVIGDPTEWIPGTTSGDGIVEVYSMDYSDVPGFTSHVRKLLYHGDADDTADFFKIDAAFRYKELLYTQNGGITYPDFSVMSGLWGPTELQRSRDAEQVLLTAMSHHDAPEYGRLLLDIYYDRTVAETILAKENLALAERDRLGPPVGRVPPASGFVIDNEIERYEAALAGLRGAMGLYFELFDLGITVVEEQQGPPQPVTSWANSVVGFSSEYSPTLWGAIQLLGAPDAYPGYDDLTTAWASAFADAPREFLELGFPTSSGVTGFDIYETWNPGAVDLVQVRNAASQTWQTVWTGMAAAAAPEARIFSVTFADPGYAVDAVRIELDSAAVPSWNEIDAVGMKAQKDGPVTTVETEVPTFGYDTFQSLVPGIHLEPATVLVGGVPEPVTVDDTVLFTGYRDLVMLYGLLKDYGQAARQLAYLHWAKGDPATANAVATDAQRLLLVNGGVLDGIFPGLDPATETDSGLDTAVAGWRGAIGDLTALQAQIDGDSTPLGFDRNFLMLVQKFQGQDPELFDSFNSIKDWLNPTLAASQLKFARDRQAAALASYNTFRQNYDEVQEQFDQSTVSFEFRLFEIAGARPGEPGYNTPEQNEGSEIWQQMQSIDLARLRIRRNRTEIDNLREEISIEMNRAASVEGVIIDYGNRQAKLTEEISHLRAAQAAAQAYADAFSIEKLNPVNIFFNAVNAGVQTGGELAIGQKEAQKERLAAGEKAAIEGIDSAARVQTLWLGMRTLVLDSQEAVILMKQETGRLAQLLRERNELERRLKERDANIARRYYADPIHRLTSNYDIGVANLAFDAAHKWLFFMARALEYKWNVPFAVNHAGISWTAGSVFKCRNGEELYGLYLAMLDFDAQIEGTRIKDDFFDWFSVREEFFGYRQFDDLGQPLTYFDSVTGETVSAIEMFRRRLKRDFLDSQGQIRLRFSTVRQIPGGSFFRGARFLPDGQVDPAQRGLYLDKIRWMKIRLPGNHTTFNSVINGSLTYGGSSLVRNEQPGTVDPARADRVLNEFTEYSTRYWYRAGQQTNSLPNITELPDVWRFRESLSWPSAQMRKDTGPRLEGSVQNPDVLPSVLQIDAFRERSVAATDWQMIIPTRDLGTTILNIDQLDDVEIYFYHYAVGRP